ncbi:MAG: nuclear transport factor 2 family protein [Candidatus Zixiibacteriota bacterium]|nr:MAG: nuclear transport factor 2 family protein [candidate division Zixibacteria bacterium]
MKTTVLLLVISLAFVGGSQMIDLEKEKNSLMDTDREFSALSVDSGTPRAFLAFMTDSATILRNNAHPFTGREPIEQLFSTWPPRATLTWEPIFADVSQNADLGYTIGRYLYTDVDTSGNEVSGGGYYITIWKKQPDGKWKFVFDTGTEGLPEED